MKQPKTTEEFFALPVFERFEQRVVGQTEDGRTITSTVVRSLGAPYWEQDTITAAVHEDTNWRLVQRADGEYARSATP